MFVDQFIFTHCQAGEALDDRSYGFQTRVCTAGLLPHRPALEESAKYLGDVLREFAPAAAKAAADNWERTTQNRNLLPQSVLDEFPVIWSFRRLSDSLVGLTRTCHLGLDKGRRFGNFFSHTLACSPAQLAAAADNPLSLIGAEAFKRYATPFDSAAVGILDRLDGVRADAASLDVLRNAKTHSILPGLLSALLNAHTSRRRVALVVSSWEKALPLVDALLQVLPIAVRRSCSFITYAEPLKTQAAGAASATGRASEFHLNVLSPEAPGQTGPQPADLPEFAVFNLITGASSPVADGGYGAFAAGCIHANDLALLQRHHAVAALLDCDTDPAACDLLPQFLRDNPTESSTQALVRRLDLLARVARTPKQADVVLGVMRDELERFAVEPGLDELAGVVAALKPLFDRLTPPSGKSAPPEPVSWVIEWARSAASRNAVGIASAWLGCLGAWRPSVVSGLWREWVQAARAASKTPEILSTLVERLVEALLASIDPSADLDLKSVPDSIIETSIALYTLLPDIDLESNRAVWAALAKPVFHRYFPAGGLSVPVRQLSTTLVRLAELATPDACPEAAAWFSARVLEWIAGLEPDRVLLRLQALAQATHRHPRPDEVVDTIFSIVVKRIQQPAELALVAARLAETCRGGPAANAVYRRYREYCRDTKVDRARLTSVLVKEKIVGVLARDFLESLSSRGNAPVPHSDGRPSAILPTSVVPQDIPERLTQWLARPEFRDLPMPSVLAAAVVADFDALHGRGQALPIADCLLGSLDPTDLSSSAADLLAAVVQILPSEPLSVAWKQRLQRWNAIMPAAARGRLAVLRLIESLGGVLEELNWSFSRLEFSDPAWSVVFGDADRRALLETVLRLAEGFGIRTAQEAVSLARCLQLLNPGDPHAVFVGFRRLLQNRDATSIVMVLEALLLAGATVPSAGLPMAPDELPELVRKLIHGLADQSTEVTTLCIDHFDRGFVHPSREVQTRLEQLREAAGLARPAAEPAKKGLFGRLGFGGRK